MGESRGGQVSRPSNWRSLRSSSTRARVPTMSPGVACRFVRRAPYSGTRRSHGAATHTPWIAIRDSGPAGGGAAAQPEAFSRAHARARKR